MKIKRAGRNPPVKKTMNKITEDCFSEQRGQETFPPSNTEQQATAKGDARIKPDRYPLGDRVTTCVGVLACLWWS